MQWLVFQLQARQYALPVHDVVEVLRLVALTPVPEAPAWLAGMLNLRGQVIPVLDLRRRLALLPQPMHLNTPIVVARTGRRTVGLIADAVTEVLTLPADAIVPPDALAGSTHPISAIARAGDQLVLLLNLERVCAGAEEFTVDDAPRVGIEDGYAN